MSSAASITPSSSLPHPVAVRGSPIFHTGFFSAFCVCCWVSTIDLQPIGKISLQQLPASTHTFSTFLPITMEKVLLSKANPPNLCSKFLPLPSQKPISPTSPSLWWSSTCSLGIIQTSFENPLFTHLLSVTHLSLLSQPCPNFLKRYLHKLSLLSYFLFYFWFKSKLVSLKSPMWLFSKDDPKQIWWFLSKHAAPPKGVLITTSLHSDLGL